MSFVQYSLRCLAFSSHSIRALLFPSSKQGGPKVYDVTKYLDDHPGGAEVMLDVAGTNADEFFEDIGHSKEARQELQKYLIGTFKMDERTLAKLKADAERKQQASSGSTPLIFVLVAILAAVLGYLQMNK
jgi:cytochrome b involved in lipid metabolism